MLAETEKKKDACSVKDLAHLAIFLSGHSQHSLALSNTLLVNCRKKRPFFK